MKNFFQLRPILRELRSDERGAVLIIFTVYLPVIVGLFTLATDMANIYSARNQLQITAEAAALAATSQLPDPSSSLAQARVYATNNMPAKNPDGTVLYGNVLAAQDVELGTWSSTCPAYTDCFVRVMLATETGNACVAAHCNAVRVTTRRSQANNNRITLAFGALIGWYHFDVTATATAAFGGNGVPWNVMLLQDISPSFTDELRAPAKQAQNADLALLNCMVSAGPDANTTLGIDVFATSSSLYQQALAINGTTTTTTTTTTGHGSHTTTTTTTTTTNNNDTLTSKISNIAVCGGSGMPGCGSSSGTGNTGVTNIGGAIASAAGQLCSGTSCPGSTVSTEAIIIVTDGKANNCGSSGCQSGMTPLTYAEQQATLAGNKGIDIYTICYGCSGSDAAWLARLVKGNGFAMRAPTTDDIKASMQKACAAGLPHRLVW